MDIIRAAAEAINAALSDDGIEPDRRATALARLTGCSAEDAAAWLAGCRLPPLDALRAIVGVLDIPPRQLVGLDPLDLPARRLRAELLDWRAEDREALALVIQGMREGCDRTEQIVALLERGEIDAETVLRSVRGDG